MTIIFLSRLFYPHIGGVEEHVLEVGRRLIKKGYKVVVVTEELLTSSSDKLIGKFEGIEIYRIPVGKDDWFKKFRIWLWLLQNKELIKKADIVHCHDVFFWYLPFRFLYPNKPVYTTFHGHETKYPPSKKSIFVRKLSESLSNGSICVGEYIKKWYGASSNYITYGGVSVHNYHATVRGSYVRGIKIFFAGRLETDAGIPIYLSVLAVLKKNGLRFTFEACGDGALRKSVERYGKVHGFVRDLSTYIEKADIVFASSYLSILQAIAQKKLVIAVYDNLLKRDYLEMSPFANWIVIENSPKDLADKILYFIKHQDEKEKMISKAYEWVKTQTWDKVSEMYMSLWSNNTNVFSPRRSPSRLRQGFAGRVGHLRGVTKGAPDGYTRS